MRVVVSGSWNRSAAAEEEAAGFFFRVMGAAVLVVRGIREGEEGMECEEPGSREFQIV